MTITDSLHPDSEQLRLQLARAEAALEHAPDLVARFDREGRPVFVNAAGRELAGLEPGGLGGTGIGTGADPPGPFAGWRETLLTAFRTGRIQQADLSLAAPYGPRLCQVRAVPECDGSGEIATVLCFARETGEPAHGAASPAGASERGFGGPLAEGGRPDLHAVLDNLFTFVGVLQLDGTLVEANRSPLELAGLRREDVIGRKFWDCHWWSYDPQVQARIQATCRRAAAGETSRFDIDARMAGQRLLRIDFALAPLRNEQGVITHLIPSAVEITERVEAERKLRSSEERLRLALQVAHMGTFDIEIATGRVACPDSTLQLFGYEPEAKE